MKISNWFSVESQPQKKSSARKSSRKKASTKKSRNGQKEHRQSYMETAESVKLEANKPLGFELELDSEHPCFDDLCLSEDTINEFGLGYCAKGFLKGYIAFPIHNREGEIVAYGGVTSDDEDFTDPRYKYPEADKFNPSLELFGLHHAIKHGATDVIYWVHSPLDVFRVWHSDGVSAVCSLFPELSEMSLGCNTKLLMTQCLT